MDRTWTAVLGDGTSALPVGAEGRRAIGKEAGDEVEVRVVERVSAGSAAG